MLFICWWSAVTSVRICWRSGVIYVCSCKFYCMIVGKGLKSLRQLKVLRLDSNALTRIDVREIAALGQLTSMDLSSNRLEDISVSVRVWKPRWPFFCDICPIFACTYLISSIFLHLSVKYTCILMIMISTSVVCR